MQYIYKCPNCGESKNLQFFYDYSKQHRPVHEVMCNFCGEFFDGDMPASKLTSKYDHDCRLSAYLEKESKVSYDFEPTISDDFQIGPDGAYEHTEWDNTLMDGLHDEEFPDFETKPGFVERRMAQMHEINDHQWNNIYDLYDGTSDLHEFIDWLKANYIAPEKI
jgi:hypothetical protein